MPVSLQFSAWGGGRQMIRLGLLSSLLVLAGCSAPTPTRRRPRAQARSALRAPPDTIGDLFLGQVDATTSTVNRVEGREFNNPDGAALDTSVTPPRLYVVDSANHRVLAWRDATFATNAPADLVLGQADLRTTASGCALVGPATLCNPRGIAVDPAGNVYVSDTGNHRVLEFDRPFEAGAVADRVYGQNGSFYSSAANLGGAPTASSMSAPTGVAIAPSGALARRRHRQPPGAPDRQPGQLAGRGGGVRPAGLRLEQPEPPRRARVHGAVAGDRRSDLEPGARLRRRHRQQPGPRVERPGHLPRRRRGGPRPRPGGLLGRVLQPQRDRRDRRDALPAARARPRRRPPALRRRHREQPGAPLRRPGRARSDPRRERGVRPGLGRHPRVRLGDERVHRALRAARGGGLALGRSLRRRHEQPPGALVPGAAPTRSPTRCSASPPSPAPAATRAA